MFETILVPTDGSDHAIRAAEHGAAMARAFDATLHVITVVDLRVEAGPFNAGGLTDEDRTRLREEAGRRIDRTVEVIDAPDVETTVVEGHPVEDIIAYGEDVGAGLIAMGTQGRTGLDRYVTGSVAEGVVRRAGVPVLTVRATDWSEGASGYDDVLVPTDASEFGARATDVALGIAAAFDARVHALHVVNVAGAVTGPEVTAAAEVLDGLRSVGERAVEEIARRADDAELAVETHVLEGVPAAEILDYAEAEGVDLVAMATAGRTGLNRFLLGSTTERVIRHAEMPVLAVNAREEPVE